MGRWTEAVALLEQVGDPRSPSAQALACATIDSCGLDEDPAADGEGAERLAELLAGLDRDLVAGLGEDPERPREEIERLLGTCLASRRRAGMTTAPLRYARVELCPLLGEREEAVERLRVARLFSPGDLDLGAALATASVHDDYSGVIRTTTAARRRPEADPAGTALRLALCLVPYLAQESRVEAEDALLTLQRMEVPESLRLRALGDELEYLGLSGQWQRGLALLRHSDLTDVSASSTWGLLNAAVGASLVLREANRAGHGDTAVGATIRWSLPHVPAVDLTGWDTVAHGYDAVTAAARAMARRFDRRNDNSAVSQRTESRMAAEAAGLARRSYGTVTATGADPTRAHDPAGLLADLHRLLVLAQGYGLDSVRESAIRTAETVSLCLDQGEDDRRLETALDLRLAFSRLLRAMGAHERSEQEALVAAELARSQGWDERACAALVIASQAARDGARGAVAAVYREELRREAADWGTGRVGERLRTLVRAVGEPEASAEALVDIAESLAVGVEDAPERAGAAREACRQARGELERCREAPTGLAERVTALEERLAGYGRGRGGRHRREREAAQGEADDHG